MPSLSECEALVRCDEPAQFWVNFHGCDNALICEAHLNQWLEWIEDGHLYCNYCRKRFGSVPAFLNWRDA